MTHRGGIGPLAVLSSGAGLCYLVPKSLGLLDHVGGSHLAEHARFSIHVHPVFVAVAGLFLALLVVLAAFRGRIDGVFERAVRTAEERPGRAAFLLALSSLLALLPFFLPFRYNDLRIPDAHDGGYEIDGAGGRLVRVPAHEPKYEDYTRNYVVARSIRRLGIARYFALAASPHLTQTDRSLCAWGLRNHPPGYHLFLAPFTVSPFLARATSVVLYSVAVGLAFLFLLPLVGAGAAVLGSALFWAPPSNLFFLAMMTSNDLAAAVVILAGLVLVQRASGSPSRLLGAGAVLGGAFLVKYTALLGLPLAAILLLVRSRRRALRDLLLVGVGFGIPAAAWILLLSHTRWAGPQWNKYIAGLLHRAVNPEHIGQAHSAARGSTLSFLAFIPFELGFPLAFAVAAGLLLALLRPLRSRRAWICFAMYAIPFVAAFLTIPKTNYIWFALPALTGAAAWPLLRFGKRRDAVFLLGVVLAFGACRLLLYGIQTWR